MEDLKVWINAVRGRGCRLARHLNVPPSFVSNMADGKKPIPVQHGAPIEQFTGGALTRQQMFPNDWQRIWPELATDTSPTTQPDHLAEAVQGAAHV